ncbi:STAS domain-containing protein [Nocardioides sp. 503]|uniref:STAS domain-containing protein n=1 Tax=Nocardioides sp. 503 TaxID=2508326 RepID=UPI00106F8B0D|nr:STAS domain-containing protein [Nocardioides sp. 503]
MDISRDGTTLHLCGDFDVRSTWVVRQALHDAIRTDSIVVDLSRVPSVDHTALKVLAFASRRARGHGHHVTLRGCRPTVLRMLHMSRLIRLVELERCVSTLRPIA